MTIRIGKLELVGLQTIYTEDTQAMVELRGPGQPGVFQDLGREPVTIVMEGILFGAEPQAALEELRQAQQHAEPLPISAGVIAGAELTDVLILELRVRQLAGTRDRYTFFMRVREHNEPPESPEAGAAEVDAAIADAVEQWAASAMDAASVVEDPSTLAAAAAANPDLLTNLSQDELTDALSQAQADMSGEQLGELLSTLGERDPAALASTLAGIQARGGLGGFVDKLASAGATVYARLARLDLARMLPIVMDLVRGTGLISDVRKVIAAAEELRVELAAFDPGAMVRELRGGDG